MRGAAARGKRVFPFLGISACRSSACHSGAWPLGGCCAGHGISNPVVSETLRHHAILALELRARSRVRNERLIAAGFEVFDTSTGVVEACTSRVEPALLLNAVASLLRETARRVHAQSQAAERMARTRLCSHRQREIRPGAFGFPDHIVLVVARDLEGADRWCRASG